MRSDAASVRPHLRAFNSSGMSDGVPFVFVFVFVFVLVFVFVVGEGVSGNASDAVEDCHKAVGSDAVARVATAMCAMVCPFDTWLRAEVRRHAGPSSFLTSTSSGNLVLGVPLADTQSTVCPS